MIVQAFWRGPIGVMERMCIQSHLRQGHEFHLYTYGDEVTDIEHVPEGTVLRWAGHIVPEERIPEFPWTSIFSDYFRYALLARNGGWWVDMDSICLKPFDDLVSKYVFASDNIPQYYISGCFMYAENPPLFMEHCRNLIEKMTPEELKKMGHMDIGPHLLQREVPAWSLCPYVVGPLVFDPIPWDMITKIVDPAWTFDLSKSYAIHLRQSIWNEGPNSSAGILPDGKKLMTNASYPKDCLWESLKKDLL